MAPVLELGVDAKLIAYPVRTEIHKPIARTILLGMDDNGQEK
jgi:hypothetical protein